jgi:hypothetical protein
MHDVHREALDLEIVRQSLREIVVVFDDQNS